MVNYQNTMGVGYDSVKQIREGIYWDGFDGDFREVGRRSCTQSLREYLHR